MKRPQAKTHWRALRLARGVEIVIRRGALERGVTAVPAVFRFEVTNYDGAVANWVSSDWIIPKEDYWFTYPGAEQPQRGDWIEYKPTAEHEWKRYEVTAPAGEQVWRYMGTEQEWRTMRVHTIEVA